MTGQNRTAPRKKAVLAKQRAFIAALPGHNFSVSRVCRTLSIGRSTFYEWLSDSDFKRQYEESVEEQIDVWEESLLKNIKAGDAASIIFALKTRGKHRGWVERESVNQKAVTILEDVLAGTITAREAGYKFALLGLPLPEVLRIELSKHETEEPDDGWDQTDVIGQIERRAQEAMESINRERETFVPERRSEVEEIKRELAHVDSFAPGASQNK